MYKIAEIIDGIEWHDGIPGGPPALVFLDGEKLGGCMYANAIEGRVKAYRFDKEVGRFVVEANQVVLDELYGDVKIYTCDEVEERIIDQMSPPVLMPKV